MAEFSVTTQTLTAASALCRAAGTLDALGFEAMEEEFGKLLASGVKAIILEASGLENMTSAALGAILNLDRLVRQREGMLVLTRLKPANEGLLEMLGLHETLLIAESPEEARKMIANVR